MNVSLQLRDLVPRSDDPTVACVRVGVNLLMICPLCGEQHAHGPGNNPGPDHGHRLSHCWKKPWNLTGGYFLRELRPRKYLQLMLRRAGYSAWAAVQIVRAAERRR